jgi:hypothetical protein
VVILSLQPYRLRATYRGTTAHLVLHVAAFAVAALFPSLLSPNRMRAWVNALCLCALAGVIEFSQSVIYRQRTEWTDLEADLFGILLAFVLTRFSPLRSLRYLYRKD